MSQNYKKSFRGRGAIDNPTNRFETIHLERDMEYEGEDSAPVTVFLDDSTRSIITKNDSPDVGMMQGINPYRGCEHGCIYCFARPNHEYLGFSCGLDFETKIMVKKKAPQLLRKELMSPKYIPQPISFSGNTDPYQPIEKKLRITRQCLEVLTEFRNPVGIITKNRLVERDIDLLKELSSFNAAKVFVTVTSLDRRLIGKLEPRTSRPEDRLRAIENLTKNGVSVGIMIAPIIPGLTDKEIPAILKAAREAGADTAGYIILRLPFAVKHLFLDWLSAHFPEKRNKIINRIKDIRGGRLNDPRYGSRIKGEGPFAEQIKEMFTVYHKRFGFAKAGTPLSAKSFQRPDKQYQLFD